MNEYGVNKTNSETLSCVFNSNVFATRLHQHVSFAYLTFSGDEIGMLEDMCVAVTELATVHFQVSISRFKR